MRPELVLSPNHGKARAGTRGIILHSTRSGRAGREAEYQRTLRYMLEPDTVSAHRVIGVAENQHAIVVEDDLMAWHSAEDNAYWLGIEFCQPLPDDEYSEWQIEQGIAVCVEWCKKYNITPETIVRHSESAQGRRNGKSDPGYPFPYLNFIKKVKGGLA